jgi:hypothetical protein
MHPDADLEAKRLDRVRMPAADANAFAGSRKITKNPSPLVSISCPPQRAISARTAAW